MDVKISDRVLGAGITGGGIRTTLSIRQVFGVFPGFRGPSLRRRVDRPVQVCWPKSLSHTWNWGNSSVAALGGKLKIAPAPYSLIAPLPV